MAEQYDNTNTFALFKNDKGDNPKRPDYRGKVNIKGHEFVISGWVRTAKSDGSKFISGTVEPAKKKEDAPKPVDPEQKSIADLDDEIPF